MKHIFFAILKFIQRALPSSNQVLFLWESRLIKYQSNTWTKNRMDFVNSRKFDFSIIIMMVMMKLTMRWNQLNVCIGIPCIFYCNECAKLHCVHCTVRNAHAIDTWVQSICELFHNFCFILFDFLFSFSAAESVFENEIYVYIMLYVETQKYKKKKTIWRDGRGKNRKRWQEDGERERVHKTFASLFHLETVRNRNLACVYLCGCLCCLVVFFLFAKFFKPLPIAFFYIWIFFCFCHLFLLYMLYTVYIVEPGR